MDRTKRRTASDCVFYVVFVLIAAIPNWPVQAQGQQAPPQAKGQQAPPAAGPVSPPPGPGPRRPAGANQGYPEYDPAAVERGQKVYQSNCSFCHGANAKGGEGGPDLLRSVLVLHDKNGDKIGPVIHNGRPDKGMPKFNLADAQITEISTFLHDRVKAAALRGTYQILNIVTGDAKAGQAYFEGAGKCNTCHSATGDLAHIGSKYEPVEVQQHIVMPREGRRGRRESAKPDAIPVMVTVTLPSGQSYKGQLDRIDDFSVALRDANGEYHSFTRRGDEPKVQVEDPLKAHTEMLAKYTDADIHNLTAYLVTLK
jgi:mono/diheme cytochrome c family protein